MKFSYLDRVRHYKKKRREVKKKEREKIKRKKKFMKGYLTLIVPGSIKKGEKRGKKKFMKGYLTLIVPGVAMSWLRSGPTTSA